jgi:hypothetical protein
VLFETPTMDAGAGDGGKKVTNVKDAGAGKPK